MKTFPVALLIAGSCLFSFQTHAQTTFLTNGLVLYYPFNGNANDAIGTNDGEVFGAILTNDMFGNSNQAYYFDGTNSYIQIPDSTNVFGSTDYTISIWFNPLTFPNPPVPSQAACFLISKGQNNFELSTGSHTDGSGMTFLPRYAFGNDWQTPRSTFQTNIWQHVVAIYEPSETNVEVFVNGVALTLTGPSNTPVGSDIAGAARLGMRSDGTLAFQGALADVRIYNRALSSQEVSELYKFESRQSTGIVSLPCITYIGIAGALYSIQYSTNLSVTNWSILASNVVLQPNFYLYTDTNAFGQPQRFYRVVPQ